MNLAIVFATVGVIFVIVFVMSRMTGRQQIERARRDGLYPLPGQTPTLEHVRALARAGQKIAAIKLYREVHPGSGLKEAKDEVEKLA